MEKLLQMDLASPINTLPELPKHEIDPMVLVHLGALTSQPWSR